MSGCFNYTTAMRDALLWAAVPENQPWADGKPRPELPHCSLNTLNAMARRGLTEGDYGDRRQLTPLGVKAMEFVVLDSKRSGHDG